MTNERNESGQYTPQHTDADILAAVRAHEPAATSEVADEVGMTRQGADRRLRQLRDEGRVASKKIGASLVWFAPAKSTSSWDDTGGDDADRIGEVLEGWPSRAEAKREQRRQAGRAVLEYLRDVGEARAGDFKDDVEPEVPVDGQSPDTWWKKSARPAMERAVQDGLVDYHDGTKVYTWIADHDE